MAYKILLVDDSEDVRDLMTILLEPEGYEVAQASEGREALQKLETETRPDLIFLDYNMDVMNGPEFLKELEHSFPEVLASVPIIMLTGTDADLVPENSATEIVAKQAGIEPLLLLVKRYLP